MKDLDMFVIEEGHKYNQRIKKEDPEKEKRVGFCKRHRIALIILGYIYLFGWILLHFEWR